MSGCVLELDDYADYAWSQSMVVFHASDELDLFLARISGGVKDISGSRIRLTLEQGSAFVGSFSGLTATVSLWRENRVLRLGRKCWLPISSLSLTELGLVTMSHRDFRNNYVADPRGRLTFSEVLLRECRHPPVCVGKHADSYTPSPVEATGPVILTPRVRMSGISTPLKPRLRDRRGKPLQSKVRLKNRVNALFYSLPLEGRRTKIPSWYSEVLGKPRYLFRLRGRDMSLQQRVVSTLCRVYHWYRFHLARNLAGTSKQIKFGRGDNIYRVLAQPMGPGWYTMASIAYRRLKVLLKSLLWT